MVNKVLNGSFLNFRNLNYLHFVVCYDVSGKCRTLHFAVGSNVFHFIQMIHDTFDTDSYPAEISFIGYVNGHKDLRDFYQLI